MAYFPPTGSVVAFQSNPSVLQAIVGLNSTNASVITVGTAAANQSVSGTVGASIVGLPPVNVTNTNLNVGGSVIAFPVGNQSVSGAVNVGSVLVFPGIISASNSTTTPVTSTLSFTGTGEEWKDFGSIVINVFSDAASATDGLSIQQSSDNSNWDIRDTYTIPSMIAGQGKTIQVQPAARFGRLVYTQGAVNSGVFRLQTIYHPQMVKPTSQRPSDGYTNETDLEQEQTFGMVYNGTTWDRARGNATSGTLIFGSVYGNFSGSVVAVQGGTNITSLVNTVPSSVQVGASIFGQLPAGTAMLGSIAAIQGNTPWFVASSIAGGIFPVSGSVAAVITNTANVNTAGSVVAFQGTSPWIVNFQNSSVIAINAGSVIAIPAGSVVTVLQAPSIVGTYAEDTASSSADKGIFVLGVRNDTISSLVSADLDYGAFAQDSAGRQIIKPFVSDDATVISYTGSIVSGSVQLIQASAIGKKSYITDFWLSNTGATTTLVTFQDGSTSVVGQFIAPTGGGMASPGIAIPLKTFVSQDLAFKVSPSTSVLYVALKGYQAP